jgi:hypothetical protein
MAWSGEMTTDEFVEPCRTLEYDPASRQHSEVKYLARNVVANVAGSTIYRITNSDVTTLRRIVHRLFRTPRQTAVAAASRRISASRREGRSLFAGSHYPMPMPAESATRTHLGGNLAQLSAGLDNWFETGEVVPSAAPERVQIILRRSGQLAWERAFVAVFCHHFDETFGRLYDGMRMRAVELEVYQLPLRAEIRYRAKLR